jgi:hypothetical protein
MPNVPLPRKGPELGQYLPTSRQELELRGWDEVDVVFVSGDAYVDHPSFAAALLGRVLEAKGFRVAILPQPDWRSADAFREFGRPRLFYAVSAGNMDSMINHYTANRKKRNDDAYSPGGQIGLRPDRATNVYAQRCREAFKDVRVPVAGGVEAIAAPHRALRLLVGHRAPVGAGDEQGRPRRLRHGRGGSSRSPTAARRRDGIKTSLDMRGVAYLLGKNEELPGRRRRTRFATPPATDPRIPSSCRRSKRCVRGQGRVRDDDAAAAPRDQPAQRSSPDPAPRRSPARRQPAAPAARPKRRWTASTTSPTRAAASALRASRSRPSR